MKKDNQRPTTNNKNKKPPVYDREVMEQRTFEGDTMRLNKFIAKSGVCSRREADKLIAEGKIKVNGKVLTDLGVKININDSVEYNGKLLKKEQFVYILLNKPKDFITTVDDPQDRRTVMDLIKGAAEERIFPVGRLDRHTTGLLLLTNDGQLADRLAHPSNNVRKLYEATLDKPLDPDHFLAIKEGFELDDGPVRVDDIAISVEDDRKIGLEIHIGRNRIVRRIFEHFGYHVIKLDRVLYAGLTKKNLARGQWRYLEGRELISLMSKGKKR